VPNAIAMQTGPRCPVCGWQFRESPPEFDENGRTCCARRTCGVALRRTEDGSLRPTTFRLADHYSLCVLPFSFGERSIKEIAPRLENSGRWRQRIFDLNDPADLERTEYFLPYVRRYLFPELEIWSAHHRDPDVEPSCVRYRFNLTHLGAAEGETLNFVLHGRDTRKDLSFDGAVKLEGPELILFSESVGFLVLAFQCAESDANYFEQMTALALLRLIAPLHRGFEMPDLAPPGKTSYQVPQLLAFLLAEFDPKVAPPRHPWLLPPTAKPPVQLVYDDRMLVYSFSCVDQSTRLADPARCRDLIRQSSVVHPVPEEFVSPESDPAQAADAWLRVRWQGFSKDGGSLVVFNSDRFHEKFLGFYNRTYYFDIFLLAALQRVTLLTLFERLSDIKALTTGGRQGRVRLRRMRKDLLRFKNQCWFSQITNRERGLELWRKWQSVFEVQTLLHEVNVQSEELDSYLQARYRERMEWLLRIGGFVATAVPAIFGLEAILPKAPWVGTLRWCLLVGLGLSAAGFAWYLLSGREDSERS
jgi:hypothetical protein